MSGKRNAPPENGNLREIGPSSSENLMIRADAGEKVGSGHVMRCLALAQAWKALGGGDVRFALTRRAVAMMPRVEQEGMGVEFIEVAPGSQEDARATIELAQRSGSRWVVLDGYCFGAGFQECITSVGLSLLSVDDNGLCGHYCADVILNQNPHAREEMYHSRVAHTKVLLGSRYALLRREFFAFQQEQREHPAVASKLLITLGGYDSSNLTLKLIRSAGELKLPGFEARVIAGPGNPHVSELRREARRIGAQIRILECADMPACMAWADFAAASASSTCWELCFLGVPTAVVVAAENQAPIAEELAHRGVALNLGWGQTLLGDKLSSELRSFAHDRKRRAEMSARARTLVDGEGAMRVIKKMQGARLKLRRAGEGDRELLWRWANDPEVRSSSFSNRSIAWEEHVSWFAKKLADPNCRMFVGMNDAGMPVGQVRFDVDTHGEAEVDLSVDQANRGCGYGSLLIRCGMEMISTVAGTRRIHAYLKQENASSQKAFERAGFRLVGNGKDRGLPTLHYLKDIPAK
ncbi:MAG: UDP-2,4-diacetamido-2,4,6-trideoxy-beta-L-altropyranose hydrolase [Candidatus Acidiferrales bacterium]